MERTRRKRKKKRRSDTTNDITDSASETGDETDRWRDLTRGGRSGRAQRPEDWRGDRPYPEPKIRTVAGEP